MAQASRRFSYEIQALRALAVGLVLLYHVSSGKLPKAGFVGVDVFFVISGFLITSHLLDTAERRGRIRLRTFYERRARRLLPASFAVLGFVLVATLLFVPQTLWAENARQIIASALYVENWALAANSLTYAAPAADTSPVQHYWSLGVEEQFYVFWPLLLMGAIAAASRLRLARQQAVLVTMGAVFVVSLALSIWQTSADAGIAYFVTYTRVWELAAGGLLAGLPGIATRLPDRTRTLMAAAGLGLIVVAAFGIDGASSFPGALALLPVVGAVLVLAAGDLAHARLTLGGLVRLRPIQWMGDISYSLYLWHWPLLILLPFILNRTLDTPLKLAVIPLSFLAADLSKRLVEDRFRSSRDRKPWLPRPRSLAIGTVLATVLVCGAATSVRSAAIGAASDAQARLDAALESPSPCLGAAARGRAACEGKSTSDPLPDPVLAGREKILQPLPPNCLVEGPVATPQTCVWKPSGAVTKRVAVVGDSHAKQWITPLHDVADTSGWELTSYWKSGCPLSTAVPTGQQRFGTACPTWVKRTLAALTSGKFDLVIVSNSTAIEFAKPGPSAAEGLVATWNQLHAAGIPVIALRDNPYPPKAGQPDTPTCVTRHDDPSTCATKRANSLLPDPQVEAAKTAQGAKLVDLTARAFCDADGTCPAIVGGVIVYERAGHITQTYAKTLAPMLGRALAEAGAPVGGGVEPVQMPATKKS